MLRVSKVATLMTILVTVSCLSINLPSVLMPAYAQEASPAGFSRQSPSDIELELLHQNGVLLQCFNRRRQECLMLLKLDEFLTSIPQGYYAITTVQDLKSLLATHLPVLIDVRELSDYQAGHIPGAINIPIRTLTQNLDKIPRDRPVVLYCSSGYRSGMGVMTLKVLNYDNVQGFVPSFAGWKAAGEAISY